MNCAVFFIYFNENENEKQTRLIWNTSGHFEFKLRSMYLNELLHFLTDSFKSIDFRFAPAFIFELFLFDIDFVFMF